MFLNYFQLQALPADKLTGIYDPRLVLLSYVVAVFASYIALDFTARLKDHDNTRTGTLLWLLSGSIAMGAGIWSMHFIGMLSFSIPGLTLQYDLFWTLISLLVAILASGFALFLLKGSTTNVIHLATGGVILGFGIASMHYTGMAAMLISLNFRYLPDFFFLSILIAVIASEAAIWFALKGSTVIMRLRSRVKLISAFIMGLAIFGMHYTGMAASIFTPLCEATPSDGKALDPTILSIAIGSITFIILGIAFFASSYKESLNQQQYEKARELGMAEIAASILHNVGNVLNSVHVSVGVIGEKITNSQLIGLEKLSVLLNEHKEDIGKFLTTDSRGVHTLAFIDKLAEYWQQEQKHLLNEVERLTKNIVFIKDIISAQQNLTKKPGLEQILSVNELIEEAVLISGLNQTKEISIVKQYGKIDAIIVDKVKLLPILDNILSNAKDALLQSSNENKILTIKTQISKLDTISIQISDNGIGIPSTDLNRIYNFGFTTKPDGHGFGLHTSAIAINELGGSIQVSSEGVNKGATFTLEIPYKRPRR